MTLGLKTPPSNTGQPYYFRSLTVETLDCFRPRINGCKDPEPSLQYMVYTYFLWGGFTPKEATALAAEYMDKLAAEIRKLVG